MRSAQHLELFVKTNKGGIKKRQRETPDMKQSSYLEGACVFPLSIDIACSAQQILFGDPHLVEHGKPGRFQEMVEWGGPSRAQRTHKATLSQNSTSPPPTQSKFAPQCCFPSSGQSRETLQMGLPGTDTLPPPPLCGFLEAAHPAPPSCRTDFKQQPSPAPQNPCRPPLTGTGRTASKFRQHWPGSPLGCQICHLQLLCFAGILP